jgi:hypothetical protein
MWSKSGLNVPTSVKRELFTIDEKLVIQKIGVLFTKDIIKLDKSIQHWLGFK